MKNNLLARIDRFAFLQKFVHYFNNKTRSKAIRTIILQLQHDNRTAQKMFPADMVAFTNEIFSEMFDFWCSVRCLTCCLTHFVPMFSNTVNSPRNGKHENNRINWCEMGLVQNRNSLIWCALPVYNFL